MRYKAVRGNKWDIRFLLLAQHVASWSKDESTQAGAVIVDNQRRVMSLGYNGFPRGVIDGKDRYSNREVKYRFIVHAEANAILQSKVTVEGCSLYVWPMPPCSGCAKSIIQSGIKTVIVPRCDIPERWKDDMDIANTMFSEAGVEVSYHALKGSGFLRQRQTLHDIAIK